MHSIVSVGADLFLLYSRGLVLEKSGASVQNVAPQQALLLLDKRPFDLLILCHSAQDTSRLCLAARMRAPTMKILLLESPTGIHYVSANVDERYQLDNGPAALLRTVNILLGGSEPDQPAPASSPVPVARSVSRDSYKADFPENLRYAQPAGLRISLASTAGKMIHMPSANLRCNTASIIAFKTNSSSGSYR